MYWPAAGLWSQPRYGDASRAAEEPTGPLLRHFEGCQTGDQRPPQIDLDEQRYVADRLDVHIGDLLNDPVRRESGHTDHSPQNRRRHDAGERDPQHVDHADRQRLEAGRRCGVEPFSYLRSEWLAQEVPRELDAPKPQVGGSLADEDPEEPGEEHEEADL